MPEQIEGLVIENVGEATVVRLSGKILDPTYIETVSGRLLELAQGGSCPKIVLDFAGVSHMSSSALGMLTTLHQAVRESGGQLRLCRIQAPIVKIFEITRLNEVLDLRDSREDAIRSLS